MASRTKAGRELMRDVLREIEALGLEVRRSRVQVAKHPAVEIVGPDGRVRRMTVSGSPGEGRTYRNTIAQARRLAREMLGRTG